MLVNWHFLTVDACQIPNTINFLSSFSSVLYPSGSTGWNGPQISWSWFWWFWEEQMEMVATATLPPLVFVRLGDFSNPDFCVFTFEEKKPTKKEAAKGTRWRRERGRGRCVSCERCCIACRWNEYKYLTIFHKLNFWVLPTGAEPLGDRFNKVIGNPLQIPSDKSAKTGLHSGFGLLGKKSFDNKSLFDTLVRRSIAVYFYWSFVFWLALRAPQSVVRLVKIYSVSTHWNL